MTIHPEVSVIMRAYDDCNQRYLRESIDSILGQTFKDFEFLVLTDNCTTSKTIGTVESYTDERIHLVITDTGIEHAHGHYNLLNEGIKKSRGKYVALMDADDTALLDRLEKQMNFLHQNPEVAVVGGAMMGVDTKGIQRIPARYPTSDGAIKAVLTFSNCIACPTVIMLKQPVQGSGGFRKPFQYAADYDLWLRMAERYRLANLTEYMLYYRIHPSGISVLHLEEQTMSDVAARFAASVRRQTNHDPIDGVEKVTRSALFKIGVTAKTLQTALLLQLFDRAALMLHTNARATAVELLDRALEIDQNSYEDFAAWYGSEFYPMANEALLSEIMTSKPNRGSDRLMASFHLGYARAQYEKRNLLQATRGIVKAYSIQPDLESTNTFRFIERFSTSDKAWDLWISSIRKRMTDTRRAGPKPDEIKERLTDDLREAMRTLLDLFAERLDLQSAFPEVLSQDYRRLLMWGLGVAQRRWDDSSYEVLRAYDKQFENLLSRDRIVDPGLIEWFYQVAPYTKQI